MSLLDETINAVAMGLSTAVYQRPLTPRTPTRRKRKPGRAAGQSDIGARDGTWVTAVGSIVPRGWRGEGRSLGPLGFSPQH